ncbi:peptidase domain-containing ABC transporter [Pseudoxanthomonas daejeonensis]|uniref:peptidase domain-containing ABC transporter n=1 Tax=Pseudoxanthomonas daejeonensis TaxID=266062 RepID=UPI001F54031F|nr:peptidase domain-containing ABC transporter [Pseudoxanthomonas daejeonensis]UNK56171.1 peptidase domain-containing ABC transporter [Pseudoxanthomonas daejeonensis]
MTRTVIQQAEPAECGLACLAILASHYGKTLPLRELRRRFPLSLKGANLSRIIGIARQLGLAAHALRLDVDELPRLRLPCILHWDLNHFVVLIAMSRCGAVIIDPANGRRAVNSSEISRRFTGVALEVAPDAGFRPERQSLSVPVRRLVGSISGVWPSMGMVLLLSLALQVFVLLAPFFMQWVVDQVLVSADRQLLVVLGIGFLLSMLLQVCIGAMRGWAVVRISAQMGMQWMAGVFGHLLRLPMGYFEKRHLGDVVSRFGSVQTIQRTITTGFVEAVIDGMMALATLSMMLLYSPRLAIVTLVAVALYLCIRLLAYRPLREGTERQLVAAARQQSHLFESIRGMQSVKVARCEAFRQSAYLNLMGETINGEVRLARMALGFSSASQLVFGVERIVVIWIGALLALDSVFSVGMLIAYLAYKDQFSQRVAALIDRGIEFRMLRLHGERLADIVLTEPEEGLHQPEQPAPVHAGIEVHGLGFRYAEGEPWVLRDCSFQVTPGESVAIAGASGCGKTTLAKLLLGLLPAAEGEIRIGGRELRQLGASGYRQMVAAVMQDDHLFAGNIADNIALGEEDPDLPRVEEAARLASVHDEIMAMPMGYHSLIGDMGTTLSGGQKQRVILARALYRQPQLLVLDEATSHLDVGREHAVNEAVRGLHLTRIIIAHRPETIASADRVLELRDGRIRERSRAAADGACGASTSGARDRDEQPAAGLPA